MSSTSYIIRVKRRTRVSEASIKTLIRLLIPSAKPTKGLRLLRRELPNQIPMPIETITCLVAIARTIAIIDGSNEKKLGSYISLSVNQTIVLNVSIHVENYIGPF